MGFAFASSGDQLVVLLDTQLSVVLGGMVGLCGQVWLINDIMEKWG